MRNDDNRVIFECENPLLLRTRRVSLLSELKSLILSNPSGTWTREVRRVGYRLLAPLGNGDFQFRLFWLLEDKHNDRPLAPPPIHVAIPVEDMEVGEEDLDQEYVANSDSSEGDDEEEFVPETPAETVVRYVLPSSHPISALSDVPSHYHTLDLDGMHERTLFSNIECNFGEVRRVGEANTWLAPTMSKDHRQLDSNLICKVILPLIQSNPSVSILVLQGAVRQSYHFKPSYKRVWMAKQKTIAQIYGYWEESHNKRLMAAIEKNKEGISKMCVTHFDRRASVFVMEELEPFEGWSQGSFRVRLAAGMCDCGLFQSLHYPCCHVLNPDPPVHPGLTSV
ncbi:hypothetical protein Ahy_A02g008767 [Arachis hypogaea]|uniref:SWIM-type domain-containing protein n=1 Tax=Arachis hypogaea TaxID=3818 RepID=A0A445EF47_ARAHY|nr:hypothetical protein Ahy_A02g008767 [Arachis hypogaea]